MELKSEKSIKEYLKTLSDDTIIKYYLDVEFSPFPILVIEEYTRRFKRKTKSEIVKDLRYQTRLARKKTQELGQMAKKRTLVKDMSRQKSQEVIDQAKKRGYKVSEQIVKKSEILSSKLKGAKSSINGTNIGKKFETSYEKLEILEKLAKLQKIGVITDKELQDKKKKILSEI